MCIRDRYTSSSVTTAGKKEFLYGRFEVRARIPVAKGAWPAIWTLGSNMEWPSCGEIDIMEYYQIKGVPHILANAAWGTDKQWGAKWNSKATPYIHFTDVYKRQENWNPVALTEGRAYSKGHTRGLYADMSLRQDLSSLTKGLGASVLSLIHIYVDLNADGEINSNDATRDIGYTDMPERCV